MQWLLRYDEKLAAKRFSIFLCALGKESLRSSESGSQRLSSRVERAGREDGAERQLGPTFKAEGDSARKASTVIR